MGREVPKIFHFETSSPKESAPQPCFGIAGVGVSPVALSPEGLWEPLESLELFLH